MYRIRGEICGQKKPPFKGGFLEDARCIDAVVLAQTIHIGFLRVMAWVETV
jgi:hypothetical protein